MWNRVDKISVWGSFVWGEKNWGRKIEETTILNRIEEGVESMMIMS